MILINPINRTFRTKVVNGITASFSKSSNGKRVVIGFLISKNLSFEKFDIGIDDTGIYVIPSASGLKKRGKHQIVNVTVDDKLIPPYILGKRLIASYDEEKKYYKISFR